MENFVLNKIKEVPLSKIRKQFDYALKMENITNLVLGEPGFDTPENIINVAIEAIKSGNTHYTPNAGIIELRKAVAEKLRLDNNIDADPNSEILITSGATEALFLSIYTLIKSGDEVILPEPCWCNYISQIMMVGGKLVPVELKEKNNFEIRADDIKQKITKRTKLIMLNSPSNPTGAVTPKEELIKLAGIAVDNNIMILSDEIYEKLIYDEAKHFSIASLPFAKDYTLTINGVSKSHAMTGWRIGYIVGNKEIIREMVKIQEYIISCVPAFSQLGAVEAIQGNQDAIKTMVNEYYKRREVAINELNKIDKISVVKPRGAFYLFVNIKDLNVKSEEFCFDLLKIKGVCTAPGIAFGEYGEGYIRISFAAKEEDLIKGIREMGEYIDELNRFN